MCNGGRVGVAAVKNTDLTPPLEGLPHHYHKAEQGANKRTKTPYFYGVFGVYQTRTA